MRNALTVDVEDYFHVAAFSQQIVVPKHVLLVSDLPCTENGKLSRKLFWNSTAR